MLRLIIEFLVTIILAMAARAILRSVFQGITNGSSTAFPRGQQQPDQQNTNTAQPGPQKGSELHKDPVCGTYVAESTPYRRQISGQTFYYCSNACKEKHALVAR
jgi:YHS domain-containing protein